MLPLMHKFTQHKSYFKKYKCEIVTLFSTAANHSSMYKLRVYSSAGWRQKAEEIDSNYFTFLSGQLWVHIICRVFLYTAVDKMG